MEPTINDYELPKVNFAEGFSYLFDLLSHLTGSRQLFIHKIYVLSEISRNISKSSFTRAEMEALFPQYPPKALNSILNSLMESQWFKREEGSLQYSISKAGLLFMRFLPFLYKGDEMDEMAFQLALNQIFQAADSMELDIQSTEFLRDQAINGLQRSIDEIKSSLVSKNSERIIETSKKMYQFLQVIDEFLLRLHELIDKKKKRQIPFNEADKQSITILLATKSKIIELLDVRKKYLMEEGILGESVFTRQDVERFLYKSPFHLLSTFADPAGYVPSNAKWVDENDIVTSLNVFLSRRKKIKSRKISDKVKKTQLYNFEAGEEPYLNKVEKSLDEALAEADKIDLDVFLFTRQSKEEVLMYLASLCFMEGQQIFSAENNSIGFELKISTDTLVFQDKILSTLSKGTINRRDK
ncbi:hypothetical protein CU633_15280 [Bacillus sp. V3-13]|uniref:hypothetical protein n=1 Tax=Bacillus sp. V3-13 TaxID=2053728 RepID=UPI000C76E4AB|nr:hypothetical protein [Bacillus sp. V3-13]PLR76551.1 hypothetical protein CU633_15280 [Bacillus sp. V3-13]